MKLHVSPKEMGEMYFYDIMLLYNRYEQYVKDENERIENEQKEYNEQNPPVNYDNIQKNVSDMSNRMGNMNFDSISKGVVGLG